MPRKFNPEHEVLAKKVAKAISGKPYAQALRDRTRIITEHVFDRWLFPPQLKKKHVANYRGLLLKYADALVDLQLPNEQLLDRQMAGEMSKGKYFKRIFSQKRAQSLHNTFEEILAFLDKHKLPKKPFGELWIEVFKAAQACPTNPKDTN